MDLCLRLDQPQLPPSLRSIPDLNFTVPAHDVPVNQEMLSAIRSIVGNDAVQDSVLEQSIYFIGEMKLMLMYRFLLVPSSGLVLFTVADVTSWIQTHIYHMSTNHSSMYLIARPQLRL